MALSPYTHRPEGGLPSLAPQMVDMAKLAVALHGKAEEQKRLAAEKDKAERVRREALLAAKAPTLDGRYLDVDLQHLQEDRGRLDELTGQILDKEIDPNDVRNPLARQYRDELAKFELKKDAFGQNGKNYYTYYNQVHQAKPFTYEEDPTHYEGLYAKEYSNLSPEDRMTYGKFTAPTAYRKPWDDKQLVDYGKSVAPKTPVDTYSVTGHKYNPQEVNTYLERAAKEHPEVMFSLQKRGITDPQEMVKAYQDLVWPFLKDELRGKEHSGSGTVKPTVIRPTQAAVPVAGNLNNHLPVVAIGERASEKALNFSDFSDKLSLAGDVGDPRFPIFANQVDANGKAIPGTSAPYMLPEFRKLVGTGKISGTSSTIDYIPEQYVDENVVQPHKKGGSMPGLKQDAALQHSQNIHGGLNTHYTNPSAVGYVSGIMEVGEGMDKKRIQVSVPATYFTTLVNEGSAFTTFKTNPKAPATQQPTPKPQPVPQNGNTSKTAPVTLDWK